MTPSSPSPLVRRVGPRLQRVSVLVELPGLSGQTVLVTGGTDGVGRALVELLAGAGARVLLTARDRTKGERVAGQVAGDVRVVQLDLADLRSVADAAAEVVSATARLDLLITSAGQGAPRRRQLTRDGAERTMGVNHLGHALLLRQLEGLLRASVPSQVLVVASEAHRRARGGLVAGDLTGGRAYSSWRVYARSKLANVLYAQALAERWAAAGIRVNAAHPGGVDTSMMAQEVAKLGPLASPVHALLRRHLLLSPEEAARGLLRVALDPSLTAESGGYYELGRVDRPGRTARRPGLAHEWAGTTDEFLVRVMPSV